MKNTPLIILGIATVGYLFFNRSSTSSKRKALIDWANESANASEVVDIFNRMTDEEVGYTHDFVFNYLLKNKRLVAGSKLFLEIEKISVKYNIFT